ncbi:MAG: biopolymer transporter ExbD [Deltaproteobacteria bacterium]|nr:biopolymer transporter ExbD [Deltaproteobacteria bacterium]
MGVSIDTGGGKGGKKPLDAELNLVPFIDLLVCCICFLLITAVWSQMARIKVSQNKKGSAAEKVEEKPQEIQVKVVLLVGDDGYTITAGAERLVIPKQGELYDTEKLGKQLREIKVQRPEKNDLTVAVEDGVKYQHIIRAMDVALNQHFTDIRVSDASAAL